jgi:hypothetical protein
VMCPLRFRRGLSFALLAAVVVAMMSIILTWMTGAASAQDTRGPSCKVATDPSQDPDPIDPPLTLQIDPPGPLSFGRDKGFDTLRIPFRSTIPIPQPTVPLGITVGDFRHEGAPGRLDVDRVVVTSQIQRSTGFILLCVDPTGGDWGRFEGIITVDDPRFEVAMIPVAIEAQYSWLWVVLVVLVLTAFAATIFKWAEWQAGTETGIRLKTAAHDFMVWAGARVIAILAALGAALGVFLAQYLKNMTWSGGLLEFAAFIAAVFAAVLTAFSAGDLVRPKTEKKVAAEEMMKTPE